MLIILTRLVHGDIFQDAKAPKTLLSKRRYGKTVGGGYSEEIAAKINGIAGSG